MKPIRYILWLSLALLTGLNATSGAPPPHDPSPVALVIHGGAGGAPRGDTSAKQVVLNDALDAGYAILNEGGTALAAVESAIVILEDSPYFNAGRGAVLNAMGDAELDASIMDGSNLDAGAVGGVTRVKNPIRAARAVMDQSPHVLLMGEGADTFAKEVGLARVPREYFITEEQKERWRKNRGKGFQPNSSIDSATESERYLGTVGAVALDREGNIAAGTSTGGLANKGFGRIGDSPIIGAGTYADNETCGISCTGHGEFFIRLNVAADISARMRYKGIPLDQAAHEVVQERLRSAGGGGGIIGVDRNGTVVVEFNTAAMARAWIDGAGNREVRVGDKDN